MSTEFSHGAKDSAAHGAGAGILLCKVFEPWGSEDGAVIGERVGQAQTPSGMGVYDLAELAETSVRLFIF